MGRVTQLSDQYINIHGLAWRGDEIWYTAADEGPIFRTVRAVAPAGGASRTITRMPGNVTLWDVLPDGQLILAHTDDRAVIIAKRRTMPGIAICPGSMARWPRSLSLDGRWLLFWEYGPGRRQGRRRVFARLGWLARRSPE